MSKKEKKEKLVLLDAHAIIHRAYHALPEFATSRGEPTGALYGLIAMILKIAADLKPDYLVACYDLPKPTYRHEVYEGYKVGRAKAEGDLIVQLEKSKQICDVLGILIYSKEGFEADDILGTIVEKMRGNGVDIIIASGDMDTLQLVDDEYVKVYTLKKGINDTVLYDEKAVRDRFGFGPELLSDFKGLRGDPSDNIVGVPGIGEKSASELVMNFGSVEDIYRVLKKNPEKFESKGIKKRVVELLKNGEEEAKFSKMLATIRRDAPIGFELPKRKWPECVDLKKAESLFSELEFRNMGARLRTAIGGREAPDERIEEKVDPAELEETGIALWVVDSSKTDPGLDDILNFGNSGSFQKAKEAIMSELRKRESESVFSDIEKPLIPVVKGMESRGVLIDRDFLKKLSEKYVKELLEIEKKIWNEAGTEFNVSSPKQLGEILFEKLGLSMRYQKRTSTGAKSTRESELQKMKDAHPIIPLILEYREFSKLISTYIEPIPKMVDQNSRLHARFIQTGTTTGRMASQNPNLQNIPVGSERGREIRKAFLAPERYKLAAFDYSQIELRIAAVLSRDEKLTDIFKSGDDVHSGVASYVFGVPLENVSGEMRRRAKVINFGILYGMGVNALSQNLNSDRKSAQEFYNSYFEKFSGITEYLERTKEEANRLGFTKTLFGRRRYFEGLNSKIPYIRAAAERMAVNAPIQGTSADVIKIAMRRIHELIKESGWEEKVFMILQIHDELVFEISKDLVDEATPKIKAIMQNVLPPEKSQGVPIVANLSVGDNWGELKQ